MKKLLHAAPYRSSFSMDLSERLRITSMLLSTPAKLWRINDDPTGYWGAEYELTTPDGTTYTVASTRYGDGCGANDYVKIATICSHRYVNVPGFVSVIGRRIRRHIDYTSLKITMMEVV